METIRSAKVLRCDAWMLASVVLDLIAKHKDNLPPECFLLGMVDYSAPGDLVPLDPKRFRWFGEWSGNSYFETFLPHVAPKICGTLEVIWTWSDGDPSGLRVVDGKATTPDVVMTLAPEET